jgi:lipase maturation factor 1
VAAAVPRAFVRDLFLRLLGLTFLVAFLSLLAQIRILVGSHGLLPAGDFLTPPRRFLEAPTIFWLGHGDGALVATGIAGAVVSFALVLGFAPRWCLVILWTLYLSFVTIGQDFLSFQWDNLLLEAAFFSLFVAPGGLWLRGAPEPHPVGVFLMLWLVFRLQFESGAAKLLFGDPTWRDLTAMVAYYETAPLPTWMGWYAHQLPVWAHRASGAFVYMAELGLPLLIWGAPRLRAIAFGGMLAMQIGVALTANYGFFNYLSAALLLFVLDDRQLGWPPRTVATPRPSAPLALTAAFLVVLSMIQFSPFLPLPVSTQRALYPVRWTLNGFRSINAYHLFAHMTLVRREAVIEGSTDGVTWQPYEFRYKPGNLERPPPFVAPHQPRVDFLLWFLLLGPRVNSPYFDHLLTRLLHDPEAVAPLFTIDPFPTMPPRAVRVAVYRYRFTDVATRRTTGAWWRRELLGYLPTRTR